MRTWGKVAALGVLSATLGAAAAGEFDSDIRSMPPPKPSSGWWPGWIAGKPAEKPPEAKDDAKAKDASPPGPSAAEKAARVRQKEYDSYQRRLAVLDKLRQIAFEKKDAEMERRLNELDGRNFAVYEQRTGGAGGKEGGQ